MAAAWNPHTYTRILTDSPDCNAISCSSNNLKLLCFLGKIKIKIILHDLCLGLSFLCLDPLSKWSGGSAGILYVGGGRYHGGTMLLVVSFLPGDVVSTRSMRSVFCTDYSVGLVRVDSGVGVMVFLSCFNIWTGGCTNSSVGVVTVENVVVGRLMDEGTMVCLLGLALDVTCMSRWTWDRMSDIVWLIVFMLALKCLVSSSSLFSKRSTVESIASFAIVVIRPESWAGSLG